MPAAAVAAAAAVGGAALSSSAAKNATKAQARATGAALGYEQQKERDRKAEYDAGIARYQTQLDDYNRRRDAIMAKYGYGGNGAATPATAGAPGDGGSGITRAFGSTKGALGSAQAQPMGAQAPMTLGSLIGTTPAFGGSQVAGGPAAQPMAMDPQGMAPPPALAPGAPSPVPGPQGPQTLADMGGWSSWDNYLNKGRV